MSENEKKDNTKKKYEIVNGDISDLEISGVAEHISRAKTDKKIKPNNIVIPKQKKQK